jgi:hypothetical protein
LGINDTHQLSDVSDSIAVKVHQALRAFDRQSWLAIGPSTTRLGFHRLADLELPGSLRKISKLISSERIRSFTKLYESEPSSWTELPENLEHALGILVATTDPSYRWCQPGVDDLPNLEKEFSRLFQDFTEIDIYDSYLFSGLSGLAGQSTKIDPSLRAFSRNRYVQTIDFLCGALVSNRGKVTINLRCPIKAESLEVGLTDSVQSYSQVTEARPSIHAALLSIAEKYKGAVTFSLDIRFERHKRRHGRADMDGEWLHGRFIVIPGACVIASDRSMDFVGLRYASDGGAPAEKLGLLDNMFVRLRHPTQLTEEISRRWATLEQPFSGPLPKIPSDLQ